jgi:hypothetical protein
MRLIGLVPVRNEDWVLGLSLRVALLWCDEVVVLLHCCTDRSGDIVSEVAMESPGRITRLTWDDAAWNEMNQRQEMLKWARGPCSGTHIAMIDADEILCGQPPPTFAQDLHDSIGTIPQGVILQMPGYNLRGSLARYHANGIWGRRWFSLAFQDDARLGWSGNRFHAREPRGVTLQPYRPVEQGQGGILHLWGASERRLIAKHAWYKITERLRWPHKDVGDIDRMYSLAVRPINTEPAWVFSSVPEAWWAPYRDWMHHLDLDAEPWQEAECRRLYQEHGPETFAGLDLFGVCG